jgi:hypothetical protein
MLLTFWAEMKQTRFIMMNNTKRNWILAAAIAGVAFIGVSAAQAQFRIDNGQARDANNRMGSGGLNNDVAGGSRAGLGIYNGVTGNEIVTGDVTGSKQFRGFVPYRDPGAFEGVTASRATDAFVKQSSGAPYNGFGGPLNSNAETVRPFFGDSRDAPPPPGYTQTNIGTPGYVPAPVSDQRVGSDLRLGDTMELPTVMLPAPGETALPGPVDPSAGQTLIMASSLYGVRPFNTGNVSDQQFIQRYNDTFGANQNSISNQELNADRSELLQSAPLGQSSVNTNTNQQQNGQQPQQGTDQSNLAQPLSAPSNSPNNAPLSNTQLQSSVTAQPLTSGIATGQSVQSRMLMPAAQQSAANATLQQQLLAQSGGKAQPMTDVEAAQQYNRDVMAAKNAAANKTPTVGQPNNTNSNASKTPSQTPANGNPTQGSATPSTPTQSARQQGAPPKIESLYPGVKAKGLSDLLKDGEDLMKQGKWYDAIQKYDTAQQVAPNNMLILVGRANAELGASSYGPADADIRSAFTQDPAMMEGQFDLRKMIGDDRLQFLVNDLKQIQQKNPNESRPVFLLAYINYNTGNERMAAAYLDLAEKRAGGNDTFFSMVRNHWTLPATTGGATTQPSLNK